MLRRRIVTALVLAALFLGALFGLPPALFTLFVAGVIGIAGWEWSHLSNVDGVPGRVGYLLLAAAVMIPLYAYGVFGPWGPVPDLVKLVLFVGCIWWALSLLWVQGYPSSALLWGSVAGRLLMGLVILVPAWLALVVLAHLPDGPWLILLVASIVAAADVGAFFTGRAVGRRKLAPAVSPGKTVEGLIGGLVTVLMVAFVFLSANPGHQGQRWQWLVVVAVTALASVLGDLVESMVKRHRGVKDSGTILPGHGGILDRIDSLSAALPVFTLLYLLLIERGAWLN